MTQDKTKITRKKFSPFFRKAFVVTFLLLGLFYLFFWQNNGKDPGLTTDETLTFRVKKGPLTISVVESGTIKAREQEIIKSRVQGATTILWLIEEGVTVEKGTLLVELDTSKLQDQLFDMQIKVQNSEAAFIQARENLDVVKNKVQSDLDSAELKLRFAKQDLEKYIEGEYPKELREAESRIAVAQEELNRAKEKLRWSKKLQDEKYLSETELQADMLAAKKAELDLQMAEGQLTLLRKYTYTRQLAELQSDVKQTDMALERAKRKATADVIQAEAELRAKESEFKRQKNKLKKIQDQISKATIVAPADGLVIYATTAKASWRGNAEPLAAGQQVKERQELIYLPKTSSVLAEIKVHESGLDKVKVGLPVSIAADALPGHLFTGKVASISPLPDAASMWFNPNLKVYTTVIDIDGEAKGLRTGMSCRAEILIEKFDDAVYVPLQAIRRPAGTDETIVYINSKNTLELRQVEVGLNNNRMVQILQGLAPGEEVLLTPPYGIEGQGRPQKPGETNPE